MTDWALEHWFLAFILIWVALKLSAWVINRVLRTINVATRGWPPGHLDADGDWKPAPKRD